MLGIPIAVIVILLLWPRVWARFVHDRVVAEVIVHTHQVTIGDLVPLTIVLRNLSWLPCPFAEVTVELPVGLTTSERGNGNSIQWRTFLLMRQEAQFETTCHARKRGRHWFGQRNLTIRLNEGLGFRPLLLSQPMEAEVVVLPPFVNESSQLPQIQELIGKVEVARWLHPDETMLRGIRTYQMGDPFKHIAWQASARTGTWMTKQFSSSSEATAVLLVNAQFDEPHWQGTNGDEFDRLCSLTATWARALERSGIHSQFATNAANPNRPKQRWYGEQRTEGIRTLLGRLQPVTNGDFVEILKEGSHYAQRSGPIVVFASFLTSVQWQMIRWMIADGHTVTIVAGPNWDLPVRRFPGLQFVAPSQVTWKEAVSHA